jgi:hypothetical protein
MPRDSLTVSTWSRTTRRQPLVLGPVLAECDDRLPQLITERVVSHGFEDTLSPAEFVVNHLADKRAMPTLLNLPLHGHVSGTSTKLGEALKPLVSA